MDHSLRGRTIRLADKASAGLCFQPTVDLGYNLEKLPLLQFQSSSLWKKKKNNPYIFLIIFVVIIITIISNFRCRTQQDKLSIPGTWDSYSCNYSEHPYLSYFTFAIVNTYFGFFGRNKFWYLYSLILQRRQLLTKKITVMVLIVLFCHASNKCKVKVRQTGKKLLSLL